MKELHRPQLQELFKQFQQRSKKVRQQGAPKSSYFEVLQFKRTLESAPSIKVQVTFCSTVSHCLLISFSFMTDCYSCNNQANELHEQEMSALIETALRIATMMSIKRP